MKLVEFLLPLLCVLSIVILRIFTLSLLQHQVTERQPGNKKNKTIGIQKLPKIKHKEFLSSRFYNIETTENFSVTSVVSYLPLSSDIDIANYTILPYSLYEIIYSVLAQGF